MSIINRLAKIERRLEQYIDTPQVHFFNSEEEYEEAKENGEVRDNDVSLIDDIVKWLSGLWW